MSRKAEATALYSALAGMWPLLLAELMKLRAEQLDRLVVANDEQVRGRIKQIDDILNLPESLQREMQADEALPD